jgi:hypothetical protein
MRLNRASLSKCHMIISPEGDFVTERQLYGGDPIKRHAIALWHSLTNAENLLELSVAVLHLCIPP